MCSEFRKEQQRNSEIIEDQLKDNCIIVMFFDTNAGVWNDPSTRSLQKLNKETMTRGGVKQRVSIANLIKIDNMREIGSIVTDRLNIGESVKDTTLGTIGILKLRHGLSNIGTSYLCRTIVDELTEQFKQTDAIQNTAVQEGLNEKSISETLWRTARVRYGVITAVTKWIDTDKAFEGGSLQIRSRIVSRDFKSGDDSDLYAGTRSLEGLTSILINCIKSSTDV